MPLELSTIVLVTLRVTRFPHAEREEYGDFLTRSVRSTMTAGFRRRLAAVKLCLWT